MRSPNHSRQLSVSRQVTHSFGPRSRRPSSLATRGSRNLSSRHHQCRNSRTLGRCSRRFKLQQFSKRAIRSAQLRCHGNSKRRLLQLLCSGSKSTSHNSRMLLRSLSFSSPNPRTRRTSGLSSSSNNLCRLRRPVYLRHNSSTSLNITSNNIISQRDMTKAPY